MIHELTDYRTIHGRKANPRRGGRRALVALVLAVFGPHVTGAQQITLHPERWPTQGLTVFARNTVGDLVLYRSNYDVREDRSDWLHEQVARPAGAEFALASTRRAIAADQFDPGRSQWFQRVDVFGRNANGRLLHYWWTPYDGWLVECHRTLKCGH